MAAIAAPQSPGRGDEPRACRRKSYPCELPFRCESSTTFGRGRCRCRCQPLQEQRVGAPVARGADASSPPRRSCRARRPSRRYRELLDVTQHHHAAVGVRQSIDDTPCTTARVSDCSSSSEGVRQGCSPSDQLPRLVEMRKQLVDRLFGLPPLPAKARIKAALTTMRCSHVERRASPLKSAQIALKAEMKAVLDRVARVVLAAEHAACDGAACDHQWSRTTPSKATSSPRRNAATRLCRRSWACASLAAAARRISIDER